MKRAFFCLFGWIALAGALIHAADPFYTNLLNEGKAQFQAGDYDDALESFRIAEFGLLDEKEYVPELYYYYALTHYKKGAIEESRTAMDRMKTLLGPEYEKAKKPPEIERDLSVMVRAFAYLEQPGVSQGSLPFFNLFHETWDLLKDGKLEAAEARMKLMKKMDGDRGRLNFLGGFLAFQNGNFKSCIGQLGKLGDPLPAEYGEDAAFCLAFSYLKNGDLEQGENWMDKVKDADHLRQLTALMDEIKGGSRENRKE